MALKLRTGRVDGTNEKIRLEVTVFEPAGTLVSYSDAVEFARSNSPTSILGLTKLPEVTLRERSDSIYRFDISYEGEAELDNVPPDPVPTGQMQRQSNALAKAQKRTTFIDPIGIYAGSDGTNTVADWPDLSWKLGAAALDSHHFKPIEIVFEPYAETHHINYYPTNEVATDAFKKQIRDILGCFNEVEYEDEPIGSLQFVRFGATPRNDHDWEFTFGLAKVPERTNVSVAPGIVIPKIRGCDHSWTKDELTFDADNYRLQPKAKLAVLGQAWPLAPFATAFTPPA